MRDYSIQNKKAWEYSAYKFWVDHLGTPFERAQKDVENPERFLLQQNTIPAEVQEILLQDPYIAELCNKIMEQKAIMEKNGENAEPEAVIPDASIPEAQPQE